MDQPERPLAGSPSDEEERTRDEAWSADAGSATATARPSAADAPLFATTDEIDPELDGVASGEGFAPRPVGVPGVLGVETVGLASMITGPDGKPVGLERPAAGRGMIGNEDREGAAPDD